MFCGAGITTAPRGIRYIVLNNSREISLGKTVLQKYLFAESDADNQFICGGLSSPRRNRHPRPMIHSSRKQSPQWPPLGKTIGPACQVTNFGSWVDAETPVEGCGKVCG